MMSIEKPCTHQERIKIEGNKPSTGFEACARVPAAARGRRLWAGRPGLRRYRQGGLEAGRA
jgi:hypothetical protein